ncbi:hypothetical protein, partial [Geobacillus stearothermophilus]|uniref:hypothetical protein n=1 Tax=Geobacillus stearothermophilus TaxID=1422 RepID=UPI002E24E09D|nr:hypothetical protein [Geobacillus stearothermophilus]MED3734003.1 hypothetical protein [Geobacillus stearothermophilus]
MTKVAIDALVETKHYYTYPDEKRKRFGKISDKFRFITKSCTCTCHESMLAVSSRTRNAKRWIFL